MGWQPKRSKVVLMTKDVFFGKKTSLMGKIGRKYAADGDRFTVAELEVLKLFDGMGQSMAIIKKLARATLVQIHTHYTSFDRNRTFDEFSDHLPLRIKDLLRIRFDDL